MGGCGGSKAQDAAKPVEKPSDTTSKGPTILEQKEEQPGASLAAEAVKPDEKKEEEPPPKKEELIRPGVQVTTAEGKAGTVITRTTTDVTIRNSEGAEEVVDIETIYVVKVSGLSVRDVRAADFITGKSDPYVTCEIEGVNDSLKSTSVKCKTLTCSWDGEELEFLGYTPGAKLKFVVGDSDLCKKDDILGKFFLESTAFEKAPYDTEMELPSSGKKEGELPAYIQLKVTLLGKKPEPAGRDVKLEGPEAAKWMICC